MTQSDTKRFPSQRDGHVYLTEGGIETEVMYKLGYELPHFAMFPLLDNAKGAADMKDMYRRYLDVAAKNEVSALMGGLDYRASPDWGALLGYSESALADANIQAVEFLYELRDEYKRDIAEILIQGFVGPRGDAYMQNKTITVSEAEDYHSVQLATLRRAGVDSAWAFTFNNIPESIGVARAAERIGIPLAISLSVDSTGNLNSGPSLLEAVTAIDDATEKSPCFYSINCSHPDEFGPGLSEGEWINRVRGIRPNASRMEKIALCKLGHIEEGDPVELGMQMGELAGRYPHMDIWGGCCGTCDVHLEHIVKGVKAAGLTRAAATERA